MAIIRSKLDRNFTTFNNGIFSCGHLSFEARGLLCTLLSKPEDWKVIIKALEKETEGTRKETRERGLRSIIDELKERGYVVAKKRQSGEMDYFVFDTPQTAETANCGNRKLLKPQTAETANCAESSVLINNNSTQKTEKRNKEKSFGDVPSADTQTGVDVLPSEKSKTATPKSAKLWGAYAAAYQQRYQGALPIRNAKTNSVLCKIVDSVGEEEAVQLVWFYLSHPKGYYNQRRHDVGTFLQDLQAIRTDWLTGKYATSVQARQAEKTAANLESHKGAIEMLKSKGLM